MQSVKLAVSKLVLRPILSGVSSTVGCAMLCSVALKYGGPTNVGMLASFASVSLPSAVMGLVMFARSWTAGARHLLIVERWLLAPVHPILSVEHLEFTHDTAQAVANAIRSFLNTPSFIPDRLGLRTMWRWGISFVIPVDIIERIPAELELAVANQKQLASGEKTIKTSVVVEAYIVSIYDHYLSDVVGKVTRVGIFIGAATFLLPLAPSYIWQKQ